MMIDVNFGGVFDVVFDGVGLIMVGELFGYWVMSGVVLLVLV